MPKTLQHCKIVMRKWLLGSCSVPSQVVPHCTPEGGERQWQGENYSYFTFTFFSEENGKENIFRRTGVTSHLKLVHVFLSFPHIHFPPARK